MGEILIRRLVPGDEALAGVMFAMMSAVFKEAGEPVSDEYLTGLLGRESFWAVAALDGADVIGGLTAHTLPMTRTASSEVLIYDLAVREDHQRQGVATLLVQQLRTAAALQGISEVFVPADDEDTGALDFYRAQGAAASPVTIFTFTE
ncbi:GNAT family N-acetyltransferase [Arthrobacter sp. ERGS1:01]|uniref:GNAT family N-acetyltransferase n=1 Tax=Arthrobacter sp. ERGS1:01 TaxID=1704044 RepID=UPI0006B41663|nr:GNAT family N-acetyltransferase [Arthrobacter sp. ERGS1:01]